MATTYRHLVILDNKDNPVILGTSEIGTPSVWGGPLDEWVILAAFRAGIHLGKEDLQGYETEWNAKQLATWLEQNEEPFSETMIQDYFCLFGETNGRIYMKDHRK